MGSIYKRKWKDKATGKWIEGDVWWLKYYRHGKPYRESSKTDKITDAQRLLRKREGEISEGKLPGVYFDKVIFDELAEAFLTDYRINGRDSLYHAERYVRKLKETFGGMRVTNITTDKVKTYIEKRMEAGLSHASINRELAALKRIFHLAAECTPPKVSMIPHFPMLKESNVRKGFFEQNEYLAVKSALPDDLRPVIAFGYYSGWRKTEILGLTWPNVDIKEGTARLEPGETKNEEGRVLYMEEELMKEMRTLFSKRRLDCPYVFHREGKRIKSFQKAWYSACKKVGLKGRLFHDFRRTAIRDMVRSGVSERVAMKISGHKTRSTFERYNIVSDQDLREAAIKKQVYHESRNTRIETDQKRGEIIPFKQAQHE